jgi:KDEL-tailed cysteine endopeptidase
MDHAFGWVKANGISSEASYPYTSGTGASGSCKADRVPVVTLGGFTDVKKGDEAALQAAIATTPVSVAIEADKSAFQLYKGGVLDDASCGTQLDHGVLAVGYGTDTTVSKDYYKVR